MKIALEKKQIKWPVYIFALGEYNFKQANVSGIQIFRAQLLALNLRKVMLNAANIYLLGFILTKCKYIYRSFKVSPLERDFHPPSTITLKSPLPKILKCMILLIIICAILGYKIKLSKLFWNPGILGSQRWSSM